MTRALWPVLAVIFATACQPATMPFESLNASDATGADTAEAADSGAGDPDFDMPEVPTNPQVASLRPAERPAEDSPEAGMWLAVDKAEDMTGTSGNLIDDPELNAYVRDVVCRVAGPYCDDVRVYVMRIPHFNATMSPNGMMQIWSGLLLRAQNEAQLAAVLGHEIGHYVRRHSIQRYTDAANKADVLVFVSMGATIGGAPQIADIARFVTHASIFAFSRDNEREADAIGSRWMAAAGYDPRAFPAIWQNLTREMAASGRSGSGSLFFSTHPSTDERISNLTAFANYLRSGEDIPDELGTDRFQRVVGKWRARFLEDEIRLRTPDTSLELLDILDESGYRPDELAYFRGEVFRERDDDGDVDLAWEEYTKALSLGDPPDVIHRSMGLVALKRDDPETSKHHFERYLELVPGAADAPMIRQMLEADDA